MQSALRLHVLAMVLLVLGISACDKSQSSSKISASTGGAAKLVEKNQQLDPNQRRNETPQRVKGRATWYGPGLYGNKTASGDVLREGTMTAAHSSLPLGTKVTITRLDTNKSVMVVINDRKPYKEGTVIDLAHGAAVALNIHVDGVARVSMEVID